MSDESVHVVMFPSAGMGHLTPFLRLAALLINNNCKVSFITPLPTVSLAESQFLSHFQSSFPQLNIIPFHLPPPSSPISGDPFFFRVQNLRNNTHLLPPLLTSLSPPPSVFISDIFLLTPLIPVTQKLSLPNYLMFISAASMFTFFAHFSTLAQSKLDPAVDIEIPVPGIPFSPIPSSFIPKFLFQPTVFRKYIMEDSPNVTKLDGVFINTFEAVESHTLKALNDGKVVEKMPPVYAVGPFVPFEFENKHQKGSEAATSLPLINWLDEQATGSVVYVCFGSRSALARDQLREIGNGLMKSGYNFLWVVKDKIVDKEDEGVGLDEVLGVELVERMKKKGLVIKEWVDQSVILSHKSIGGFVSHCGWNSLMEAVLNGLPILCWPLNGDQKISAGVVEDSGWGIWDKSWGWAGERVVKGEEIGDAIKEMMENENLKVKAMQLKEEGMKAISVGGDIDVTIQKLIQKWKNNANNV